MEQCIKDKYFTNEIADIKNSSFEELDYIIKIPKENKHQTLKELEFLGIKESFLFPELENQMTDIKTNYENLVKYKVQGR